MIELTMEKRLFIRCPHCKDGVFRVDHLGLHRKATGWTCDRCHGCINVEIVSATTCEVEALSSFDLPVTVTLRSNTVPPIILKLNAWKYVHSQKDTQEEYTEHQRYYYNEHTCPTNWVDQIEQIEFEGNTDPHGLFEFISVEDGHLEP